MSGETSQSSNQSAGKPLVCPQCRARYQTDKPTFGRRVRCRHCGHVWRDETRVVGQVADALGAAAASFGQAGSTMLASTEHGSTMARLVAGAESAKPLAASEWIGRTLGRYQIKSVLGQGAMGYVFEAFDTDLKREVALKMLPRSYETDREPVGVRMFVQEARVAAKLQHPNIVTVHEIGSDAGHYFFAMERVRGITLAALVEQRGPLPANQACFVIAHAARALAAAHKAGVVHRDVKPSNIMVDNAGHVKVTDFGLADVEGLEGIEEVRNRPVGTPGWLAPEVARGEGAKPASDIYSLGLVLHAVLTGRRMVHAQSKEAMIRMSADARSITREDLPPSWPPRLRDIVVQCLQADPKHRYQSAEMLAMDLFGALAPSRADATMNLSDASLPPPGMVKAVRPLWSWLALGVLGGLVVLYAVWWWFLRR